VVPRQLVPHTVRQAQDPLAPRFLISEAVRLSWIVYRGDARQVTFDPEQMKTWQDTRVYANSPWSPPYVIPPVPPDGKWVVQATFDEPGTYVLRALASDGALFSGEDLTIIATR
jgi:hypothetical protein